MRTVVCFAPRAGLLFWSVGCLLAFPPLLQASLPLQFLSSGVDYHSFLTWKRWSPQSSPVLLLFLVLFSVFFLLFQPSSLSRAGPCFLKMFLLYNRANSLYRKWSIVVHSVDSIHLKKTIWLIGVEIGELLLPAVHVSVACQSQGWNRLEQGAKNKIRISCLRVRDAVA